MRDRRRPSHPKIAEDSPEGEARGAEMGAAIIALADVGLSHRRHRARLRLRAVAGLLERRHAGRRRIPSATIGRPRVPARGRRMPCCRTGARRSISSAAASCCCGSATTHRIGRRWNPRSPAAACRSRSWRSPMPGIGELYERRFVLVRPDGHVAWRGDAMPDDPLAVVDRVRGARVGWCSRLLLPGKQPSPRVRHASVSRGRTARRRQHRAEPRSLRRAESRALQELVERASDATLIP